MSASHEQTLSGTGARVYTAHRGWLGVVTGISSSSTGDVLVSIKCLYLYAAVIAGCRTVVVVVVVVVEMNII